MTEDEELEAIGMMARRIRHKISFLLGKPMDNAALKFLDEVADDERTRLRQKHGMKFPRLVFVILPSIGFLHIDREDRTKEQVQGLIVKLIRQFPAVEQTEIAKAIMAAYPTYRP